MAHNGWQEVRIDDVISFVSGGTPSKDNASYWNGTIPWVSAKDMKRLLLEDTEDHISEEGVQNGTRLVQPGTVFVLTRGMTLLNDVPMCIALRQMAFNQDVKAATPKAGLTSDYLPYLLLGSKQQLLNMVDLAGHGTGRINTDELKSLLIPLPQPAEQLEIARVMRMLDDKIELNRKMNETLEAMTRALFKSWFVDFDPVRAKAEGRDPGLPAPIANLFPDSFEHSELGEIPSGWSVGKISDLALLNKASLSPAKYPEETFAHFSIPAYDDCRKPRLEIGSTIKSNKFTVPDGAILLSKLNPSIPRVWLPDVSKSHRPICSTEFLVVISNKDIFRELLFSLFTSDCFRTQLETLVSGTSNSHQRVRPGGLLDMQIVKPDESIVSQYTQKVRPILQRVQANIRESGGLTTIRDALLPKLISGEVRVKDAARLVEASV